MTWSGSGVDAHSTPSAKEIIPPRISSATTRHPSVTSRKSVSTAELAWLPEIPADKLAHNPRRDGDSDTPCGDSRLDDEEKGGSGSDASSIYSGISGRKMLRGGVVGLGVIRHRYIAAKLAAVKKKFWGRKNKGGK